MKWVCVSVYPSHLLGASNKFQHRVVCLKYNGIYKTDDEHLLGEVNL